MKHIYVDTETTGLKAYHNEVTQFAAIVEIGGKVVDEINLFFRPERKNAISAEALAVTKKTLDEVLKYPLKAVSFKKLIDRLDKHIDKFNRLDKFTWVGQNAPFDMRFVEALFKECGNSFFGSYFDRRAADLMTLSCVMRKKGHLKTKSLKLEEVAKAMCIKYDAHDALADIRTTREVWLRFEALVKEPAGQGQLL